MHYKLQKGLFIRAKKIYNTNMDLPSNKYSLQLVTEKQKNQYNKAVSHVMQSWEWGEFRESLGLPVMRYGLFEGKKLVTAFTLTLHKIPFTHQYVGYLPKGPFPNKEFAQALEIIARDQNCAFIKIEPNISAEEAKPYALDPNFTPSPKPLFTKFNFVLDLTPTEEELLKNMHPKTRYNVKLAEKKGVTVEERTDDKAFEIYLKLYFQTTNRQNYHGHDEDYHRKVWKTLRDAGIARLLIGFYNERGTSASKKPLSCWMLLNFKDTLYYPYGGSSVEHKEVMANNLVAWEAIKLGKKMGLKRFDMWGALGPDADPNDPWQGFHRFKQGYGGKLVEYIGTFDLIFNDPLYWAFTSVDKFTGLKVLLLKMIGK
jgi:lipid II:glycine glycyltransferase (peptidoglycan interpeptide bridge formation enzyme)